MDNLVPLRDTHGDPVSGGTTTADRVADVLLLLASSTDSVGVSAISRRLELPKAVVYRILQSLSSRQLVRRADEGSGYRLGPAAVTLGVKALGELDVRGVAQGVLRKLRDETGETTTLSQRVGAERVYLDQFVSRREIKMSVDLGHRNPLHAGASGKVILAFLDRDTRERLLSRHLERLTPATITSVARLREELREIAERGTAASIGERLPDAGSVAAPVIVTGEVYGAISVCGPVSRFDRATVDRYRALVREAAARLRLATEQNEPAV
jgi:IclR family acetate operon transcriptional repressor